MLKHFKTIWNRKISTSRRLQILSLSHNSSKPDFQLDLNLCQLSAEIHCPSKNNLLYAHKGRFQYKNSTNLQNFRLRRSRNWYFWTTYNVFLFYDHLNVIFHNFTEILFVWEVFPSANMSFSNTLYAHKKTKISKFFRNALYAHNTICP